METQTLSGFSRLLSIFQMPNHQSCKNYFWSAKYYIRTCRVGDVSYKDVCVCTFHLGVCGFIGGVLCVLNCFSRVWLFVTPMDRCPPGFSVREILQARILEWVAMPSSRGSSWPRDQAHSPYVSRVAARYWVRNCTRGEMDLVLITTSLRGCELKTGKLPLKWFSALCLDK